MHFKSYLSVHRHTHIPDNVLYLTSKVVGNDAVITKKTLNGNEQIMGDACCKLSVSLVTSLVRRRGFLG